MMVNHRNRLSIARLFSFSAQCAMVTVTPEESSSSVLIAGMPQAPIGVNFSANPGPAEGQWLVKPGQRYSLCSRVERSGTDMTRAQKSAPKKPAKNITSEKMNQLMPQRKDRSSQAPYLPPSDSRITSPNQRNIINASRQAPMVIETQPPIRPSKTNTAPSAIRKSAPAPMIGQGIGAGTA